MARVGIPLNLNYTGLRDRPFWRVLERLAINQMDRHLDGQILQVFALQSMSVTNGMHALKLPIETLKEANATTSKTVRAVARMIKPWLTDDDLSSEEDQKRQLENEADDMIAAFLAEFEPHNLEAYLKEREKRLVEEKADARK